MVRGYTCYCLQVQLLLSVSVTSAALQEFSLSITNHTFFDMWNISRGQFHVTDSTGGLIISIGITQDLLHDDKKISQSSQRMGKSQEDDPHIPCWHCVKGTRYLIHEVHQIRMDIQELLSDWSSRYVLFKHTRALDFVVG